MTRLKKVLIGLAVLLLLGLAGAGIPAWTQGGAVPVAQAADCDGNPPPPDPDCPAVPTPTPTPLGH